MTPNIKKLLIGLGIAAGIFVLLFVVFYIIGYNYGNPCVHHTCPPGMKVKDLSGFSSCDGTCTDNDCCEKEDIKCIEQKITAAMSPGGVGLCNITIEDSDNCSDEEREKFAKRLESMCKITVPPGSSSSASACFDDSLRNSVGNQYCDTTVDLSTCSASTVTFMTTFMNGLCGNSSNLTLPNTNQNQGQNTGQNTGQNQPPTPDPTGDGNCDMGTLPAQYSDSFRLDGYPQLFLTQTQFSNECNNDCNGTYNPFDGKCRSQPPASDPTGDGNCNMGTLPVQYSDSYRLDGHPELNLSTTQFSNECNDDCNGTYNPFDGMCHEGTPDATASSSGTH